MFTGCSAAEKQALTTGSEWKQSNSKSETDYQIASIKDGTIEIYYASDNGETTTLYWSGTFIAPTTADDPYTWTSTNDHAKTDLSLLGSSDDTKEITYDDGLLSYKVGLMGTTTTVKLAMQKQK